MLGSFHHFVFVLLQRSASLDMEELVIVGHVSSAQVLLLYALHADNVERIAGRIATATRDKGPPRFLRSFSCGPSEASEVSTGAFRAFTALTPCLSYRAITLQTCPLDIEPQTDMAIDVPSVAMGSIDPSVVLHGLSLDDKIRLLSGDDMWHTAPVPEAGIPRVRVSLTEQHS